MENYTLSELDEAPIVEHDFCSGHFPIWFLENKDPSFKDSYLFTVIRDPVQRVLSHCRFIQKQDINRIDIDPLHHQSNWICKMLTSDPDLEGDELLENCKKNLEKFDFILFQDDPITFENDVKSLFSYLQIPYFESQIPKINTTKGQTYPESLIAEVSELNALDCALYAYAKKFYKGKKSICQVPFCSKLSKKAKTKIVHTFDKPMLGASWHRRENVDTCNPIYQHILNKKGVLYFYLRPGKNYTLEFRAMTMTDQITPWVEINDKKLRAKKCDQEEFALYRVNIPKKFITRNKVKFSFCANSEFRVQDLYPESTDTRTLSMALNFLSLHEKR